MKNAAIATDPILEAKTIRAFIIAVNEKFGTKISFESGGVILLEKFFTTKITVYPGDGDKLLYCAQADKPSSVFGLIEDAKGVIVLKIFDKEIRILMNKCK